MQPSDKELASLFFSRFFPTCWRAWKYAQIWYRKKTFKVLTLSEFKRMSPAKQKEYISRKARIFSLDLSLENMETKGD